MATHSGRGQSLLGTYSGPHQAGVPEGSWAAVPVALSLPRLGPGRGAALPFPPWAPSSGSGQRAQGG